MSIGSSIERTPAGASRSRERIPPSPNSTGAAGQAGRSDRRIPWRMIAPLGVLLAVSPVFCLTDLDLAISRQFFDGSRTWPSPWVLKHHPLFWGIYRAGVYPGLAMFVIGIVLALDGLRRRATDARAKAGVFLVAMFLLSSGLLVEGFFKTCWGRPRPQDVAEFGGNLPFVRLGRIGPAPHNSSFPSGHATIAFYVLTPAYFLFGRSRKWAYAFIGTGLALGCVMGFTRVAMGGHFTSDVLWSAGMIHLCGWGLMRVMKPREWWHATATDGESDTSSEGASAVTRQAA